MGDGVTAARRDGNTTAADTESRPTEHSAHAFRQLMADAGPAPAKGSAHKPQGTPTTSAAPPRTVREAAEAIIRDVSAKQQLLQQAKERLAKTKPGTKEHATAERECKRLGEELHDAAVNAKIALIEAAKYDSKVSYLAGFDTIAELSDEPRTDPQYSGDAGTEAAPSGNKQAAVNNPPQASDPKTPSRAELDRQAQAIFDRLGISTNQQAAANNPPQTAPNNKPQDDKSPDAAKKDLDVAWKNFNDATAKMKTSKDKALVDAAGKSGEDLKRAADAYVSATQKAKSALLNKNGYDAADKRFHEAINEQSKVLNALWGLKQGHY